MIPDAVRDIVRNGGGALNAANFDLCSALHAPAMGTMAEAGRDGRYAKDAIIGICCTNAHSLPIYIPSYLSPGLVNAQNVRALILAQIFSMNAKRGFNVIAAGNYQNGKTPMCWCVMQLDQPNNLDPGWNLTIKSQAAHLCVTTYPSNLTAKKYRSYQKQASQRKTARQTKVTPTAKKSHLTSIGTRAVSAAVRRQWAITRLIDKANPDFRHRGVLGTQQAKELGLKVPAMAFKVALQSLASFAS
jgi:hypothetical protein